MNAQEKKTIVFTALSKKNFFLRMLIVKFVLEKKCVPINPFMLFDYYLLDTVERDTIRSANNNLVALVNELWVCGSISNGVMAEILQTIPTKKPIRFFAQESEDEGGFSEISKERLVFEDGMEKFKEVLERV